MNIKVIHPISLRPGTGRPVREFPAGVHSIDEEEYGHWFIKACLRDGRAVLLADEIEDNADADDDACELVAPTRNELARLKNSELEALLRTCGANPAANMKKADLVDLLLAGHEGVTLVKGPDGVFVQKSGSAPLVPPDAQQAEPDNAPVQKEDAALPDASDSSQAESGEASQNPEAEEA